ncbi:MAG: TolC family protein [Pseudomonadales bacterium]|nr:TolC family protein [Pseudomonadales bacterium]NRA14847.1 TolC family protein [Oceanospirillaceae bacterium]
MNNFLKIKILALLLVTIFYSQNSSAAAKASENSLSGLAHALQTTMAHHPALKGKQAEMSAQNYTIESTRAGRFPSISGQLGQQSNGRHQGSIRLQQPLWTFGKIDTAIKHAQAGLLTQSWQLLEVQRLLIEDTAAAYGKLQGIRQRAKVANSNVAAHQRLYQQIKRRQQGQMASKADTRLAYSRLLQAKTQRQSISGELTIGLNQLQAITQIQVNSSANIDRKLVVLPALQQTAQLAIENSAVLQAKRQDIEAKRLKVKQQKISTLPSLYLRLERDLGHSYTSADSTRLSLVLEGDVQGLGYVSRAQVKSETARLSAAKLDLQVAQIDINRRIKTLMINRDLQQLLARSQKQAINAVTGTMNSVTRQYQSGRKSWIEVLNTRRELNELRLQLAKINSDWLVSSLRVATLIGNLDELAGATQR